MQPKSVSGFAHLAGRQAPGLTLKGQASGFPILSLDDFEWAPIPLDEPNPPPPPPPPYPPRELRGTNGPDTLDILKTYDQIVLGLDGEDFIFFQHHYALSYDHVMEIFGGDEFGYDNDVDIFQFDNAFVTQDRIDINLVSGQVNYRRSPGETTKTLANLHGFEALIAYGYDVTLTGNSGNNTLTIRDAALGRINGGDGYDFLSGSDNAAGSDTLSGGNQGDQLYGWSGTDTLQGDNGNDTLFGGDGNDLLHGGANNDKLYGEAGADTLTGTTGSDTLYGGLGNDVFVVPFGVVDADIFVKDFRLRNDNDRIHLFGWGYTDVSQIMKIVTPDDTYLYIGSNVVKLHGFTAVLQNSHFFF